MTAKLSCFILLLTFTSCAFGQDTTKQNLFLTGIYLDNLHVTIPWNADYRKIISIGNPTLDMSKKSVVSYRWDSVKILNDISINLRFTFSKRDIKRNKPLQIITFFGIIKSSDVERIKSYLLGYTNKDYKYYSNTIEGIGGWKINSCLIKTFPTDRRRKSPISFFDIQKSLPKQNGL